jgi:hypothetical protein
MNSEGRGDDRGPLASVRYSSKRALSQAHNRARLDGHAGQ